VKMTQYRGMYFAKTRSQELYELLRKPRDALKLKAYIEHTDCTIASFLRGFCDSEAVVHDIFGTIQIPNMSLKILRYI